MPPEQYDPPPVTVKAVGKGLTVTTRVEGVPSQFPGEGPFGVKIYETSIALPVVFIKVSFIEEPLPLPTALLIPATTALVQVNVELATLLVIVYPNADPLQTVFVKLLFINDLG